MAFESKASPYQRVTDQILAQLDNGVVPWQRPWSVIQPQSIHGHPYRGVNLLLLTSKPYSDPRWITWNMISRLRGRVTHGEKATPIVFWNLVQRDNLEGGKSTAIPVLKVFHVWNVEQCENLRLKPLEVQTCDGTPIERAEAVIQHLPWHLTINTGTAAYWSPSNPDAITLPPARMFRSVDAYYSTAFHEIAHATGHSSRLDRGLSGHFGDPAYGFEELVAQFTTAFVCASIGIDNTVEQDAAYIGNWARVIRDDPKMIVKAAGLAQKAADYILGVSAGANSGEEAA